MLYYVEKLDREANNLNIKALRMSANLTQDEVSEALGVQRSTVAMWETGRSVPRTELVPRLAKLFGCTLEELFKDADSNAVD